MKLSVRGRCSKWFHQASHSGQGRPHHPQVVVCSQHLPFVRGRGHNAQHAERNTTGHHSGQESGTDGRATTGSRPRIQRGGSTQASTANPGGLAISVGILKSILGQVLTILLAHTPVSHFLRQGARRRSAPAVFLIVALRRIPAQPFRSRSSQYEQASSSTRIQ